MLIDERKAAVLIAVQQALLGEVSERLRAVIVTYDHESIAFDCYYDGDIQDEDREAMLCAETEVMAVFPSTHQVTHRVIRHDHPAMIPKRGHWAFYRKEPLD